jgi:hypothetical protein
LADNTTLPGTGDVIADDDIASGVAAGAKVQRVKAGWGTNGTYVDPEVANPLPVQGTIESTQMSNAGTIVTPRFAVIASSSVGNTAVVTADATHKIRVLKYAFVSAGANAVKFQSATTDICGAMQFAANGGISEGYCPVGHFETAVNQALNINLGSALAVGGSLVYVLI